MLSRRKYNTLTAYNGGSSSNNNIILFCCDTQLIFSRVVLVAKTIDRTINSNKKENKEGKKPAAPPAEYKHILGAVFFTEKMWTFGFVSIIFVVFHISLGMVVFL